MNKLITFLVIPLFFTSCTSCCRYDTCPEKNWGQYYTPYSNSNIIRYNSNFGEIYELHLNYNNTSAEEPDRRCRCFTSLLVSGNFLRQNTSYPISLRFINEEARADSIITPTNLTFEFGNISFNHNLQNNNAEINGGTFLGNYTLNSSIIVPNTNYFESVNGSISALYYSPEEGVFQFTLNDTIWQKIF